MHCVMGRYLLWFISEKKIELIPSVNNLCELNAPKVLSSCLIPSRRLLSSLLFKPFENHLTKNFETHASLFLLKYCHPVVSVHNCLESTKPDDSLSGARTYFLDSRTINGWHHHIVGKIAWKIFLPQVGFESGTSHLLLKIVIERSRVRIPVRATVFFHVQKFAIFSYCGNVPLF